MLSSIFPLVAAKLLALLSCLASPVLAQTSGKFSFLTYNVAGLPAFLSGNGVPGDKGTNANSIGRVFAEQKYDIIHVQEDFAYHAYIYATDNHPVRTPTTGTVPFGSGLNSLANFPYTTLNRVKWDKCNLNSGDCLTPKGFSMMRMQIASGVEVDLYNLHADAGGDQGDFDARASGVDQILAYIAKNSAGRAVIVAGDTNDRYTNSGRSITRFLSAGFKDSWVERVRGGVLPIEGAPADACSVPAASSTCEIVDKILYRSGDRVKLDTTAFRYDSGLFVQANSDKLSDHNPVRVDFTFSA
ncbi:Endonuclease/exonuclease/phosphatase [Microdochium bolleyi]|uniref:Endonuclease/exonuclease/phosphatase n=1 Tax=Microdochium bolleyi TaxID=196109 RepID=A0A136ITC2_9PEZI|nr:Endonuclease/exonuclease/phosphatase [Microdochium bolleyi]